MKNRTYPCLLAALSLLLMSLPGRAETIWRIESASLAPKTDVVRQLTVKVAGGAPQAPFAVIVDTRLTKLGDSFVSGDKLAIIGESGRASAVVIVDLSRRREIDWFYCYGPRRVSKDWIVYVEWYPPRGTGVPREVVLLYDLSKSPSENRLPGASKTSLPPPVLAEPIQVGQPIYPEDNVRKSSYSNMRQGAASPETVMTSVPFQMLPSQRLVFLGAEGEDFARSRNFLVVVDLSKGESRPTVRTLEIPKDKLDKPGENTNFVKVTEIKVLSPSSIRLGIPAAEYGTSGITVDIDRQH